MRLVIDSSSIISAVIRDSSSRNIIFLSGIKFYAVQEAEDEVAKYKNEILNKAGISEEEYNRIIKDLFKKFKIINKEVIQTRLKEAEGIIGKIDIADVPFIAAALALKCGIWSDDKHFQKQDKIRIWKTKDLAKLL